jgi:arsenate reductase
MPLRQVLARSVNGNLIPLLAGPELVDLLRARQPRFDLLQVRGTTMQGRYNVLFLCTGNSARSIMAEAILKRKGLPNFIAYSAGSHPAGFVRPEALKQLEAARLPTEGLRSKSWEEFAKPGAPELHFVFTVCDNAAKEVCPIWPGQPMTAHWGVPDPAAVEGTPDEVSRAFRDAFFMLDRRISIFMCLPLASLDKLAIQKEIDRIGHE